MKNESTYACTLNLDIKLFVPNTTALASFCIHIVFMLRAWAEDVDTRQN